MRLRRKPKVDGGHVPRGWFRLSPKSDAQLSDLQRRLLQGARERLEVLSPEKARGEDSWASLEPLYDRWNRSTGEGVLWLCIPIEGKRHDSLQIGLGGRRDRGRMARPTLAWDDPRKEAFRVQAAGGAEDGPIAEGLDWLEVELRQRHLM